METYKDKWDHVLHWIVCQVSDINLTDDQKNAYGRVLAVMTSKEQGIPFYSEVRDEKISSQSMG